VSSVAWGDYDNDGDLDLILSGATGSVPSINLISRIYRNDSGVFTDINAGLTGVYYGSIAWGDYDNDGDLDILIAGSSGDQFNPIPISRIYRNDPSGAGQGNRIFIDISAGLNGVYRGSVAWGDYDNDGDLDILLTGDTGSSQISRIYQNNTGIFTDINAGLPGTDRNSVAWGDYDNDGDLDILISGHSNGTLFSRIYNNDAGSFTDINAGLPGEAFGSVAWGDYDNDGDLDFLLTGYDGGAYPISRIYRNEYKIVQLPGAIMTMTAT